MAILWMDGCDTYAASADLGLRYPGGTNGLYALSTTAGRFGGGAFSNSVNTSNLSGSYMGPVIIPHSGASAIIVGGAHSPLTNNYPVVAISNSLGGSGTIELMVYYDNGVFKLYRGPVTTLLATGTGTFAPGIYHHIEVKATVADSGGTCEVRIDGSVQINFTGDTRQSSSGTAGIDRIGFVGGGSLGYWDDVYVLDTSGSVANNFLGDCRINTLAPTSDSSVQFTRSTGASNYLCVDEGRYNSDTDYVESATVGHIDKYGYQDLAAGVATVYGVQAICWARKTDATTRTMRQNIYSNASTSAQTAFTLSTSYAPFAHIATLNPDGSVQWTPTTVNAALAGIEVVS
jgi:hypothetical protein